jgi:hypothetical protein
MNAASINTPKLAGMGNVPQLTWLATRTGWPWGSPLVFWRDPVSLVQRFFQNRVSEQGVIEQIVVSDPLTHLPAAAAQRRYWAYGPVHSP